MNNISISAIIIAKNEEENIGRCLDSLKSSVDEIIVIIDDCSTDNTLQIVKNKEVKYEVRAWQGYVKTKQYAIKQAANDWILWIDADEALTAELSDEINKLKGNMSRFSAFSIPRRAYFLNKWIKYSGWYPGKVIRLFNKNMVKFKDKDVHEHLVVEGPLGELKNDIEHWTDPTIEHYFNKFNLYTTLAAREMSESNKKAGYSDIILRPAFLFFKMFFLKRGFLDGLHGFILAIFSSVYVFTKYCKLKELNTGRWKDDYRNNSKHP